MAPQGKWYLIEGINPVPWKAPNVAGGAGMRSPHLYKDEALRAYQEALKEEFLIQNPNPDVVPDGDQIELAFSFWRRLDEYEIGDGKKSRDHRVDATNMQKSTEDALQGILYENDRDALSVSSKIIAQSPTTEPAILVWINHGATVVSDYSGAMDDMRRTLSLRRKDEPSGVPTAQQTRIKKWDVEDTF